MASERERAEAPGPDNIRACHVMPSFDVHELWTEAKMVEVIQYLQGGLSLALPEEWQGYFPQTPRF